MNRSLFWMDVPYHNDSEYLDANGIIYFYHTNLFLLNLRCCSIFNFTAIVLNIDFVSVSNVTLSYIPYWTYGAVTVCLTVNITQIKAGSLIVYV